MSTLSRDEEGAPLRCWVSQPVHQHAYALAAALQDRGLLDQLHAGAYVRRVPSWLPPQSPFGAVLWRRHYPGLDPRRVRRHLWFGAEVLTRGIGRPGGRVNERIFESWLETFDRTVARRLLRTPEPPNVVHAFEGSAGRTLTAARQREALAVLDDPSPAAAPGEKPAKQRRRELERAAADLIVVPTPDARSRLENVGVPPQKIAVVEFGVDTTLFSFRKRSFGEPLRMLFVGNDAQRKGLPLLLEASDAARKRGEWTVDVVGAIDPTGRSLRATRPIGVRWYGSVPRLAMPSLYDACDILVLPTHAEGSALVTYEAMAAGLAVVTTRAAGSVIDDGVDGLLVDANAEALGAALSALSRQPDRAARMATAAAEKARRSFTWQHYVDRLLEAYSAASAKLTSGATRGNT